VSRNPSPRMHDERAHGGWDGRLRLVNVAYGVIKSCHAQQPSMLTLASNRLRKKGRGGGFAPPWGVESNERMAGKPTGTCRGAYSRVAKPSPFDGPLAWVDRGEEECGAADQSVPPKEQRVCL
jgi:hypothetical protein